MVCICKVNKLMECTQTCIPAANHQYIAFLGKVHIDERSHSSIPLVPIEWANILAVSGVPVGFISIRLWHAFSFKCHYDTSISWHQRWLQALNLTIRHHILDQYSANSVLLPLSTKTLQWRKQIKHHDLFFHVMELVHRAAFTNLTLQRKTVNFHSEKCRHLH